MGTPSQDRKNSERHLGPEYRQLPLLDGLTQTPNYSTESSMLLQVLATLLRFHGHVMVAPSYVSFYRALREADFTEADLLRLQIVLCRLQMLTARTYLKAHVLKGRKK